MYEKRPNWNYCPACRQYVPEAEVVWIDGEATHDHARGGCGNPVFDCLEEEFWGEGDVYDSMWASQEEGVKVEELPDFQHQPRESSEPVFKNCRFEQSEGSSEMVIEIVSGLSPIVLEGASHEEEPPASTQTD